MRAKLLDRETEKAGRSYDADLYGWVEDQMALLRANDVGSIDALHITQELADLGRSEFDKLVSAVRLVLQHLLKWDYQPAYRSRSWVATVREQRRQIGYELDDSPSLKPRIQEAIRRAYPAAVEGATKETQLPDGTFPEDCPYNWEEITTRSVMWDHQSR